LIMLRLAIESETLEALLDAARHRHAQGRRLVVEPGWCCCARRFPSSC